MKFSKTLFWFGLFASGAYSAVPTLLSLISDVFVDYGSQTESVDMESKFGNSPTAWSVKSLKGKIFVEYDSRSPYFTYYALPGKSGADTLVFTASNASGAISDTAQFFIRPMNQPILSSPLSDLNIDADGLGSLEITTGFMGYIEQYSVRSLRGKISIDHPDNSKGRFTIRSIDGQRGGDSIIVTAKNPVGTAIDTFGVQIKDVVKPVRGGYFPPDITLDPNQNSSSYANLASSFSGKIEKYLARSAKDLFLVKSSSATNDAVNLQAIAGKYGLDTLFVEARNRAGSAHDTILVNILAPKAFASSGVGVSDLGIDYGSSYNKNVGSFFTGRADRVTVTSLRGKVSFVQNSMENTLILFSAIPGQIGTDTIALMAQRGSTILKDTFLITIWPATAPNKPVLSDLEIEQGSSAILTPHGSYTYGTSYQFSSKYGKVALIENEPHTGYINVLPLPGQIGIDTVYLTVSNFVGTQKDTIQVSIRSNQRAPARIKMIPDKFLAHAENDNSFVIGDYFKGKITHFSLRSLHSKIVSKPVLVGDFRADYIALPGQSGVDTVVISVSSDLGSASDTFQVVIANPVAPVRIHKSLPISLVYGGNDATFIDTNPFAGDVQSYEFSSLHGRATGESRNSALVALALPGQTGRDTLIIKAIGQAGIAYDTIEVNISAAQAPVRIYRGGTLIVESDKKIHQLINVEMNFSPSPDSLSFKFLRGGLQLVNSSAYRNAMLVNAGFSGLDTLLITATNSAGSTTDTVQIQVLPQRVPVRACAMDDYNMQANLRSGLISISSCFVGGLDTLIVISKNGKTNPSVPAMLNDGFYITSLGTAGDDTLLISASNSKGTAYDTIVVHISTPTAPVFLRHPDDRSVEYLSSTELYLGLALAGDPQGLSFKSLGAKFEIDQSSYAKNRHVKLIALPGKIGLDTLLMIASNSIGSVVDTIVIEILPPFMPVLVHPVTDLVFSSESENKLIDLKSIFAGGAETYSFKSLSGKTQATLQNNGTAYALSFTGAQSGSDTLIITASNGAGSASDTIVVQYNFTSSNLPVLPSMSARYQDGTLELWSADLAQIELVDLFGRNLLRDSLRGHRQIRMDLAPGFYVVRIWNASGARQLTFELID